MQEPERITLAAGTLRAEAAPALGGSLLRFFSADREGLQHWLRPVTPAALTSWDPRGTACFPLVPFCNRIRDGRFDFAGRAIALGINPPETRHAIHGQGFQRPWQVIGQSEASLDLLLVHPRDAWPFNYVARQRLSLDAEALTLTLTVENHDEQPMPAGIGQHFYWPRTPDCIIAAAVEGMWETDAEVMPVRLAPPPPGIDLRQGFPVDSAAIDNTFTGWDGQATVTWPERGMRVRMTAEPPLRFLVAYTPAGANFFAFEPVSQVTDAVNLMGDRDDTGMAVLRPGESLSATVVLRPEAL